MIKAKITYFSFFEPLILLRSAQNDSLSAQRSNNGNGHLELKFKCNHSQKNCKNIGIHWWLSKNSFFFILFFHVLISQEIFSDSLATETEIEIEIEIGITWT